MIDAADWGLAGVGASAFLSATILPGNSEIALAAYLHAFPARWLAALLLASLANTAGGATSVWLGRRLPRKELNGRALGWLERFGAAALLLSWVPVVGDALCVAAGWLRLPWGPVLAALAAGKTVRYVLISLPFVL